MTCTNCNTIFVNKPTQAMADSCSSLGGCGQGGILNKHVAFNDPVAFCAPGKIGPRKNREKVREQIKDYVLAKLGAPVVSIELDSQQLDILLDYAIMVFEDYAPRDYYNYYVFNTTPGRSVYPMPPDIGLIRNVYYRQQPGLFFSGSDLGGVLPIEYYYPGGAYSSIQGGLMDPNQPIYGRMGEWVMYKQYEQMYARLSSSIGGWEIIDGCNIKLYPIPCRCNSVIVYYLQQNYDFKRVTQGLCDGAFAQALQFLGRIRSKYTTIPGPSGGVQLDGMKLLEDGERLWLKFEKDMIERFGDGQLDITWA